jgi:glycosyltransferase involved in cell wall biosynthesis
VKVLVAHNQYLQRGGEDAVFEAECELLERYGHEVVRLVVTNEGLGEGKRLDRVGSALSAVWNARQYSAVRALIRRVKPRLLHCHNTFPRLSPSVYYAAANEGLPVIQTLHNFRLLCTNALLFRDGGVCRECVGKLPISGVRHACYRASRVGSAVVGAVSSLHRALGTWERRISRYIALSKSAKREFVAGGLPEAKIAVKCNFVYPDPGRGAHRGGYALFVGRLAEEKGVRTLLSAWNELGGAVGWAP